MEHNSQVYRPHINALAATSDRAFFSQIVPVTTRLSILGVPSLGHVNGPMTQEIRQASDMEKQMSGERDSDWSSCECNSATAVLSVQLCVQSQCGYCGFGAVLCML